MKQITKEELAKFQHLHEGMIIERKRWITDNQAKVLYSLSKTIRTLTEISKDTGLAVSSVQKALKKLVEVHLVKPDNHKGQYVKTYDDQEIAKLASKRTNG